MNENNRKGNLKNLHDICNWKYLNNVAIEYHDLQDIIYINYQELFNTKNIISDHLNFMKYPEFIGINNDIPEYCVVSLMLGILTSKHSFVNIPLDETDSTSLKNSLHMHYLFSKGIIAEGSIMNQLRIHNEHIYLIKLHGEKENAQKIEENHYAYAICTSGTTGVSKVIRVSHSCIVPNIVDLTGILTITERDKIAQFTSFTFDPSIIEIFLALSNAGTLFMVSKSLKNDPNGLIKETYSSRVTILQTTPSVFLHKWSAKCLKTTILGSDTWLKAILFGGEPFPKAESLLKAKHPCNRTKFYNIYGITEVSCWASINEITLTSAECDRRCLGQILSETIFQVKDEDGEILSQGTGSLDIGSYSRVCAVKEEKIEELELPIFRDSGDIVDIDEKGNIFYKGRKNSIVKRFGNKVDLSKLEESMLQVNDIKSSYILWDENDRKLHLCLIPKKETTNYSDISNKVLEHLQKLGPLYKPDDIHFLNHVEFTSNGKISIEFLKQYCSREQTTNEDRTEVCADLQKVEDTFKSCWKNSLRYENNGFIKLGGTSITALQISNNMSKVLNIELTELIGMLLRDATVNECLIYIKTAILNNQKSKMINDSTYRSTDIKTIPLIKCAAAKENVHEQSKYLNVKEQECACQWYKCRGRSHRNESAINQMEFNGIRCDRISKIEILNTYDLEKCVDASPTLFQYADGNRYAVVGSHSGIVSTIRLEGQNRSSAFRVRLPDRIEASVLVLDSFKGVVGCYDGNVYCFHLKTGDIIWKYRTRDVLKCTGIFCKRQDAIFIGSYDGFMYRLSAKNGAEVWKVKGGNGSITASGCFHTQSNTVLFGTLDGFCLAAKQCSGEITWRYKLADPVFVAPVTLKSGLVLFCSVTGALCCFDINVDLKMWEYKINGNVFSYIVEQNNENIIIASQNKNVYCLQSEGSNFRTEPTLKCVLNFHSSIFATPWCENNFLLVACTDGTLYLHSFATNRSIRSEKLPGEVFSSPVVDNDIAIIGCRDNNVYVLKFI